MKKTTDLPRISRRDALTATGFLLTTACGSDDESGDEGAGGAGGSGPGPCAVPAHEGDPGPEDLFQHGVASGDPLPDRVILWTRVSPSDESDTVVHYRIYADTALSECVGGGEFTTDASRDFTVKIDATDLEPATTYYYRFYALGRESPIGRTKTAPTGPVDRLRFGVVSCSSLAHGYFHAYRRLSERPDLDAILHLGDYIYEYGTGEYGNVREYEPPHEILTLDDYRTRYKQYRRDLDLQEVHRQNPMIPVWDDHETANNAWSTGALNHDPDTEGDYQERRQHALQAYLEWLPIRGGVDGKIWRTLKYGDLAELIMIDTRIWGRDEMEDALVGPLPDPIAGRTLLGDDQASWLEERIITSESQWKIIGQQVMMSLLRIDETTAGNPTDQWQGYPTSRTRLLEFVRDSDATDVVVLTGDIHSSWAWEVPIEPLDDTVYDPATGEGAVLVEFVTPAITSPGLDGFQDIVETALPFNPGNRLVDLVERGYIVLDVTPERTQAAWYWIDDITDPNAGEERFAAAFSVATGSTQLTEDGSAAADVGDAPAFAP